MIGAIDGVSSNSNSTAAVGYTPTFTHPKVAAQDAAVLSLAAQMKLLEQQGLSVGEIANQLGLSSIAVQTDLGIAIVSPQAKVATA
jgi:hypothetical protein